VLDSVVDISVQDSLFLKGFLARASLSSIISSFAWNLTCFFLPLALIKDAILKRKKNVSVQDSDFTRISFLSDLKQILR
jgi:hypothetical protein